MPGRNRDRNARDPVWGPSVGTLPSGAPAPPGVGGVTQAAAGDPPGTWIKTGPGGNLSEFMSSETLCLAPTSLASLGRPLLPQPRVQHDCRARILIHAPFPTGGPLATNRRALPGAVRTRWASAGPLFQTAQLMPAETHRLPVLVLPNRYLSGEGRASRENSLPGRTSVPAAG